MPWPWVCASLYLSACLWDHHLHAAPCNQIWKKTLEFCKQMSFLANTRAPFFVHPNPEHNLHACKEFLFSSCLIYTVWPLVIALPVEQGTSASAYIVNSNFFTRLFFLLKQEMPVSSDGRRLCKGIRLLAGWAGDNDPSIPLSPANILRVPQLIDRVSFVWPH